MSAATFDLTRQVRREIVAAANEAIIAMRGRRRIAGGRLLSMRQYQRAVFVCRQYALVPDLLVRAGHSPSRGRS